MKYNVKRHAVVQPLDSSYRKVPLTKNQDALVDADIYDWVMQWNWHAQWSSDTRSFYAVRNGPRVGMEPRQMIQLHREILGLKNGDARQGDHINTIRTLDNRRANLRIAEGNQNSCNQRMRSDNSSGFKGVSYHKRIGKYQARIQSNGIGVHLGYFDLKEDANETVRSARTSLHGEFARFQ